MSDTTVSFDLQPSVAERVSAEALIIDVDGYEGPLDLLLMLSRTQKVDLRKLLSECTNKENTEIRR